jgi:hypothetical protein
MVRLRHALVALALFATGCGGAGQNPTAPSPPPAPTTTAVTVSGWLSPLEVGQSVQLTASAVLSDGSSRFVTTEATWQSSNAAVAIVSPAGLVVGQAAGSAEIRATYQARTGALDLSVTGPDRPPSTGLACGVERWPVKTLSDPDAVRVRLNQVETTTIKALNGFASHCSGLPQARTFAEEFQVFEVVGRITYVKLDDDRDYHVAVADSNDSSYTLVAEVADIACEGAVSSRYRDTLATARNAFISLLGGRAPSSLVGTTVRLRGVGFFDFGHGQNGRARNCMELHPVLVIARQ